MPPAVSASIGGTAPSDRNCSCAILRRPIRQGGFEGVVPAGHTRRRKSDFPADPLWRQEIGSRAKRSLAVTVGRSWFAWLRHHDEPETACVTSTPKLLR